MKIGDFHNDLYETWDQEDQPVGDIIFRVQLEGRVILLEPDMIGMAEDEKGTPMMIVDLVREGHGL